MFSENDRISQRQMERQIVLVLLCPAFWQLAAYGASDGLPGMAGIFVGYGLLAVWCIYLVRLGGLYCRLESVMGKAGKLLLAVMYLCYLLFLGGTLLRRMAELAAAYLTAGVPQELCGLFLLAAAGFGVGSEVQKRGRLAEALYPWIVGGILILLLLTVPQMHFSSFEDAWETAKSVEIVDNGILFGWNVWRTLENGTPIALLPFLLGHVQKEHRSVILPVTQSIWKTGLLVIAGSMALLGVFGRRGTAAAQDPLLLLMAGTSLPGGFLERFDILWMAFLLMGLLFTLGKSAVLRIAHRREDGTVETAESLCTDRYSAFYMAAVMRGKRLVGPIRLLSVFPCHHGAARLLPEAYEKTAACVSGAGQYDFPVILRGSRAGKAVVSTGGCL